MKYQTFGDLPEFIQKYIREIVNHHATEWVTKPTPALHGRSFIEFINAEGVRAAAAYLTNVGTKFGIPNALTIPSNFRDDA